MGPGLSVAPCEVTGDPPATRAVVPIIGDLQRELLERREVGFDGVEPTGVGGSEDRLHVVTRQVLPHPLVTMGVEVVHDDVESGIGRVAGAQAAEGGQDIAVGLPLPHLADQAVGMHIVEGEELFRSLQPPVGGAKALGMAFGGPAAAVEGTQFQRTALVEADHRPVFGRRRVEVEDAVFFRSNSGSGDSFQVFVCWKETPSRRRSRRTHSSVMGGRRP